MWIKTQGGYLLNLDKVEYISYGGEDTYAYGGSPLNRHVIAKGDHLNQIYDNINRGTKIMEVR